MPYFSPDEYYYETKPPAVDMLQFKENCAACGGENSLVFGGAEWERVFRDEGDAREQVVSLADLKKRLLSEAYQEYEKQRFLAECTTLMHGSQKTEDSAAREPQTLRVTSLADYDAAHARRRAGETLEFYSRGGLAECEFISKCDDITSVHLFGSEVNDQCVALLLQNAAIHTLRLQDTSITSEAVNHIAAAGPRLRSLAIHSSDLSGAELSPSLSGSQLQKLKLVRCDLTETSFCSLPGLNELDLSFSTFSPKLLCQIIPADTALAGLNLSGTKATSTAVDNFLKSSRAKNLAINFCEQLMRPLDDFSRLQSLRVKGISYDIVQLISFIETHKNIRVEF